MATIQAKLFSAASAYGPLTSLLGTPLRWYDKQLLQGSAFPAVTVLLVDNPKRYTMGGRQAQAYARIQFTIWGQNGEDSRAVENALASFLDQFWQANGLNGLPAYDNHIVMVREGLFAQTQPPLSWVTVDAMIYNNDTN